MNRRRYTDDERAFLNRYVPGHSFMQIAAAFNARFSTPITTDQAKEFIHNNGLNTGRTGRFEKGHVPANKGRTWDEVGFSPEAQARMRATTFSKGKVPPNMRPVGSVSMRSDGYLYRKVAETVPSRFGWAKEHHLVWEAAYGPVPAGMRVGFIDGDHTNLALDNLRLVTPAQVMVLNHNGVPGLSDEALLAGELSSAVYAKQKQWREGRKRKDGEC